MSGLGSKIAAEPDQQDGSEARGGWAQICVRGPWGPGPAAPGLAAILVRRLLCGLAAQA